MKEAEETLFIISWAVLLNGVYAITNVESSNESVHPSSTEVIGEKSFTLWILENVNKVTYKITEYTTPTYSERKYQENNNVK